MHKAFASVGSGRGGMCADFLEDDSLFYWYC